MNVDLIIRISAFVGIFGIMAVWERLAPRRQGSADKAKRWVTNLAMVGFNTVFTRALLASGAFGAAVFAGQGKVGLFHQLDWPWWVELNLAVIMLDVVVYFQHVLMHAVPILWRLHMVHHSDVTFDVTTGVRFHPLEIALSMFIKIGAVILLGASPGAVLFFEVLLNATSMFNHSNVRISRQWDRLLRWIVVTPDMHRVHHSAIPRETNRNFGFILPWWDRLLGTYLSDPSQGHEHMTIGLEQYRDSSQLTWMRLMALPFVGNLGNYPTWHDEQNERIAANKD
jgi:sterol desaturase/sphingolipid hydroxylase (fatty acid hydroxylase superfamily)